MDGMLIVELLLEAGMLDAEDVGILAALLEIGILAALEAGIEDTEEAGANGPIPAA